MKVIFLARELDSAKIIADALLSEGLIAEVIFETGRRARRRKLVRMFKRKPLWRVFVLPLDILFLLYMTWRANKIFYRRYSEIPRVEASLIVDDANDKACVNHLMREQPDIVLVYGTAILKKTILSIPKIGALNIHGAIVPKYRNVHGEFWAVAFRKFDELGTSILWVDEGIDTGDIVTQRTLNLSSPVSVSDAKLRVFEETVKMTMEVMREVRRGSIPRRAQAAPITKIFQTPTLLDWLRYRVRI